MLALVRSKGSPHLMLALVRSTGSPPPQPPKSKYDIDSKFGAKSKYDIDSTSFGTKSKYEGSAAQSTSTSSELGGRRIG